MHNSASDRRVVPAPQFSMNSRGSKVCRPLSNSRVFLLLFHSLSFLFLFFFSLSLSLFSISYSEIGQRQGNVQGFLRSDIFVLEKWVSIMYSLFARMTGSYGRLRISFGTRNCKAENRDFTIECRAKTWMPR